MKTIFKILAFVFTTGLLGYGIYYFFMSSRGAPPISPTSVVGEQEITQEQSIATGISGGIPINQIPEGETLFLQGMGGLVKVNNFYKNAVAIIEDSEVVIKQTSVYEIDYSKADGSFYLTLQSKTPEARTQAEGDFLKILGINPTDACRLNASVVLPINADPYGGGKTTPLSFCGSVLK